MKRLLNKILMIFPWYREKIKREINAALNQLRLLSLTNMSRVQVQLIAQKPTRTESERKEKAAQIAQTIINNATSIMECMANPIDVWGKDGKA